MKRDFLLLTLFVLATLMSAQHTDLTSYYSSADGKCGATLKTALRGIIRSHTDIGYDGLWTAYQTTDKRDDGKLYDIYSNTTNYVIGGSAQGANYQAEGESYNREHLVPQSVFNEASPMKSDAHFVYPADGFINNMRSNYPFGKVGTVTKTSNNGYSKLGSGASSMGYTSTVFEPNDEYKGDIARAIFYVVTCYQSELTNWKTFEMFDKTTYPSLTTWAKNILLQWSEQDPVSQKEIDRNNAVDKLQGNRNPFVDYPGLEQYIWGDLNTTNVDLASLASGSATTVIRPVITPNGGTFSSSQSVTITCATSGTTIYYTTDGSTPSSSNGTLYSGAFTLTSTTTVKAIAYDGSNNASSVAMATFTKSSSGGSVGSLLYESFSGYTSTNDGTTEITTSSDKLDYSSWSSFTKIYLGANGCGKMGSGSASGSMTATGLPLSGEGTLTFKVKKYGSDTGTLNVTVSGATATGDIQVTPQSDWTDYTVSLTGGTGNVSLTFATSTKRAYIDEIRLEAAGSAVTAPDAPTFTPADGTTFTTSLDVSISCATSGTTIYYTTDGTTPTNSSTLYSGAITLLATTTIKAVAYDGNDNASTIATATFTKTGSGSGSGTQLLYESFSGYSGASDASSVLSPSSTELDYSGWTTLTNIYAGGTSEGYGGGAYGKMGKSGEAGSMTASGIALNGAGTLTFMLRKWSSDTGVLNVTVTGATATGDVTVTPTDTWTKYTVNLTDGNGNVSITLATSTRRARIDEIELVSGAAEETTPADPTFSPAGGTYTSAQNVTISCATSGAVIHYTTDGSTPTASSPTYSSAISLDTNGTYTMKAIAVSSGGTKVSGVATATYTIDIPAKPNAPRFSLAGGTYNTPQSIQVVADDDCTIKYYWGESSSASPTTNYTIGSNAVEFNTAGTYYLKAVAVKNNIQSDVTSAEYVYAPTSASGYSSTEFVKATSIDDLVDTRPCIIVCENQNLAFQTISSSKGIGVAVTINNNAIDISGMNTKPAVYTLGTSTVSGTNYMTFKSGGNYIKASASNSTNLATESSLTDNSRWSVSISSGDASMVSKISTTRMILYQTSGACFRNYASSNATASGYSKVQIYVGKTESAEPSAASVTTGIYRIKDAVGYLCINTDGTISKTDDPTNLGTIFTVVNNGSGNYKLEAQGKTIATYSGTSVSLSDNTTVNMTDGTNNQYIAVGDKYINADAKAGAVGAEWTFDEVETTDNDLPSITLNRPDQTGNTYYRTFFADFPFTPSSGTAYTVSTSGGMATTTAISGTVPANTAVLIISNESPINIVPQSDDINLSAISGNELVGTCQPKAKSSVSGTVYVFSKKDAGVGFYKYSGTTLGANKAYLVVNGSNAPSYILDFNSAATSIDALETETKTDGAYYDLSGRRILNPAKGVYIRNGKKVLVR